MLTRDGNAGAFDEPFMRQREAMENPDGRDGSGRDGRSSCAAETVSRGGQKTILLASHSAADIAKACDIVYEMGGRRLRRAVPAERN